MKQIGSDLAEAEKKRKNVKIFSYVILGMLILSSIGYAFLANPNSTTNRNENNSTNGLIQNGNSWIFRLNNVDFVFYYSPEELKGIQNNILFNINSYAGKEIYIDSPNLGVSQEIFNKLGYFATKIQEACYGNCTTDLPEKNCNDYLIVFRENLNNSISQEENCVFIDGDLRAVQAFEYKLFGLI